MDGTPRNIGLGAPAWVAGPTASTIRLFSTGAKNRFLSAGGFGANTSSNLTGTPARWASSMAEATAKLPRRVSIP
ncbi:MAG: hypothetical protein JWM59_55 [Verrucomicrobiales bacterium]|nr:hypothetical protein [Verrucomicrobiales bacterium]